MTVRFYLASWRDIPLCFPSVRWSECSGYLLNLESLGKVFCP